MATDLRPLLLFDRLMLDHVVGPIHPEHAGRLQAVLDALADLPEDAVDWDEPAFPDRALIERVHDTAHIDRVLSLRGQTLWLEDETPVTPGSVDAAMLATRCAADAVDAVVGGACSFALSLGRPPGHHATRDQAMGFCFFNNVAVAAAHGIEAHGLERVAVVDWDVHHGNGTQDIFYDRDNVLFVSSHQSPLYPGTGTVDEIGSGPGEGYTVNTPMPPGFDDAAVYALYERIITPILRAYQPQLLLISAGFDMHRDDPLAHIECSEDVFAALTTMMVKTAAHCACPMALVLEGGYNLQALARSVRAVVAALCGMAAESPVAAPVQPSHAAVIDELARAHRPRWSSVVV